jgi:hypothetical protein
MRIRWPVDNQHLFRNGSMNTAPGLLYYCTRVACSLSFVSTFFKNIVNISRQHLCYCFFNILQIAAILLGSTFFRLTFWSFFSDGGGARGGRGGARQHSRRRHGGSTAVVAEAGEGAGEAGHGRRQRGGGQPWRRRFMEECWYVVLHCYCMAVWSHEVFCYWINLTLIVYLTLR